jgi:WD40 repeat protein/tRNA A-37 threonylcarbamoyl transferase component Bud32
VEAICTRFEEAWAAGGRPALEEQLQEAPAGAREVLLAELLRVEMSFRKQAGEALPVEDYRRRFAQDAALVDVLLRAHAGDAVNTLSGLGPDLGGQTPAAAGPPQGVTFPGFEILGLIGSGGMGVVYRAWQAALHRVVALKMLKAEYRDSPERLARFRVEAEAMARLQHPNIVTVYEVGGDAAVPFLVMEYVEGSSLAARLAATPLPPREAAGLIETLACAVEVAHSRQVLHRDLTPANVLFGADEMPKISDFGLAKLLTGGQQLTQTEAIMGTPSYMAPEQARGESKGLTPACDVYALGAILYDCLTGRPPFKAATPLETMLHVISDEPVPPRHLLPALPRDLDTICLKCLQKEPHRRYQSAGALADDLRRFLDGQPIAARPLSLPGRAWRWAKRNPGLAGTLGAVAALLLVLAMGSAVAALVFREERNRAVNAEGAARDAEEQAETRHKEVQRLLAESLRSVAGEVRAMRLRGEQGAYFRGMAKLKATLTQARELNAPDDVIRAIRDEMGNLLTVGDIEITREWDDFPAGTDGVRFAPRLDRYARLKIDGVLTVHETGTGKELSRLPGRANLASARVCFSHDGRLLFLCTEYNSVSCWNVDVPDATRRWADKGDGVWLSPDGKVALYSPDDNTTKVVNALSGKDVRDPLQGHVMNESPVHPVRPWVALRKNSSLIAVDYQTGKQIGAVKDTDGNVCWHPVAPVVAVKSNAINGIYLWDVTTGQQVVPPLSGYRGGGVLPWFDRTGRYLLTTEWAGIIRIWDAATGRLEFQAFIRPTGYLVFGQDGESVAAAVDGQKLQLFRAYPGEGLRVVRPANPASFGWFTDRFAAEPSGEVIAIRLSAGRTAYLSAWTGRELGALPGKTHLVASARKGSSLLSNGDRRPEWWPVRVERGVCRVGPPEPLGLPLHTSSTWPWGVSADGRVIGVDDWPTGGVFVWDKDRPGTVQPTEPHHKVGALASSPDGRWILAGSHVAGGVAVYEARTGKRLTWLLPDGGGGVFSPGGRWVGVWGEHGGATLFRAGTWEAVRPLGDGRIAFSPDDQLVVVGESHGLLRLVATESGKEITRLETDDWTNLEPLGFSPDGGRLYAVGAQSGLLYIWDLRLIRARLKDMKADWEWPEFAPAVATEPVTKVEILAK